MTPWGPMDKEQLGVPKPMGVHLGGEGGHFGGVHYGGFILVHLNPWN